jgi:hypothetical protein
MQHISPVTSKRVKIVVTLLPEVHETETPDVRAVAMVEQTIDLLSRQSELSQLEKNAETRRNDA